MEGKLRRILRFLDVTDVFFAVFDEEDRLIFANRQYRESFFLGPDRIPALAGHDAPQFSCTTWNRDFKSGL
nr:hypothetical protein [Marinicella sp. W31]MDC2878070.1 hypothetical protein [Marinicella sp. W31]